MKVSKPLAVTLPPSGVYFAESVHAQDFAMSPRADTYHKLVYVLRGRVMYLEAQCEPVIAVAGALLFVPARTRHLLEDEEPSTLLLLCFGEGFVREEPELQEFWQTWAAARMLTLGGSTQRGLEGLWRRALVERAYPRPGGASAARALALQVLVLIARQPLVKKRDDAASRVAAVAREIEETFFEKWSLDGAAERAGLSRRHFSAHFRAAVGKTFWDHLTAVRLAHAAELLTRGEHSITGVIFACGFGDVSQFYRLFHAKYGCAPKAWAEGKAR